MTRVCIKTFGCAHNMADSEAMAEFLSRDGFEVVFDDATSADVVVINTCTVKTPTDDKFFSLLKKTSTPVVLAGCIPQSQKNKSWLADYSAIGIDNLSSIPQAVRASLGKEIFRDVATQQNPPERDFLPASRKNPFIAIIPLLQGCLGNCTYCKTKSARGTLKSYPLHSIITQFRLAKLAGIKEVWLVSEDNGAYGLDSGTSLPTLLQELLVIGGVRVRVGMLNPQYAFKYKEELAKLLQHDMFYKFLHIPVQSGSDVVLRAMNRPYTIAQYKEAIATLRKAIPDISLATDIICGYPSETDEDFSLTMQLLDELGFDAINISKFYPRPETVAAHLKPLPTKIIKQRSTLLSRWFSQQNNNQSYEGTIVDVLFTDTGKNNSFVGKTIQYKQVIVHDKKLAKEMLLGTYQKVKIVSSTRDDLKGELKN